MKKLFDHYQLDQLITQITGEDKIQKQEDVMLMSTRKTHKTYKHRLNDQLGICINNFNTLG